MNEYLEDRNEYLDLEKLNFNQMNKFVESFINTYEGKINSKYTTLIKDLFQKFQNSSSPEVNLGHIEYFRKFYHFYDFENNFYCVVWDIDLAKTLIKNRGIKPQKVKVSNLLEYVDIENLSHSKLQEVEKLKKFEPVILSEYDLVNPKILIDGNHRVYSRRNQPNSYLDVYFIDEFLSKESMAGDLFKYLFALHYNVIKIAQFHKTPRILRGKSFEGLLDKSLM